MEFLCSSDRGDIVIFGIPFDSTTCFRPGARFAPDGIRFFSENLENYSPELDKSLEELDFVDAGNVDCGVTVESMIESVTDFMKDVKYPVMLGGEHSVTYPVVKSLVDRYGELCIVQFDAHADLRDEYLGTKFSHACVMRRILELGCKLVQVGIRSGTKKEFELMKSCENITYLKTPERLADVLIDERLPVYFTVDIDFFDPAFAPGTGTPEVGGFSPLEFFEAIYKLPAVKVVGFDVVEVSPPYDPSGTTQALAAKIVRELILKFWG